MGGGRCASIIASAKWGQFNVSSVGLLTKIKSGNEPEEMLSTW